MRSKNKIRRNLVSWKTRLAAALFSVLFIGVSAILIVNGHADAEILMVSFITVFLAIYAAVASDMSWKTKFGVILFSALLVGVPAILIICVYQNYAIWMMPVVTVCVTGFYAGIASGAVPIDCAGMQMTFDGQRNARRMTDAVTLAAPTGLSEGPPPMVSGIFLSYAEILSSRGGYDDGCGIVFRANESGSITPHGM